MHVYYQEYVYMNTVDVGFCTYYKISKKLCA